MPIIAVTAVSLAPGTQLGGYEIVAPLGAGAMGEVYRAREPRLGRDVALKVLPGDLAAGAPAGPGPASRDDRRARFEREARALASLNHPHIAHIYGIVESGADGPGLTALAMELVEGRTLAEAIPPSGMPPARVFDIALELADALAAAHGRGIVHRDLKPSNIMLRTDGHVKVLDFGIAKLRQGPDGSDPDASTALETVAGGLIGTPAYMSPEQAEGRPLDGRSDLFSLGVVLYEAATGTRPFTGSSPVSILSAIVRDTPRPVTLHNRRVPHAFGSVIDRLLAKDPADRYQKAEELRAALEAIRFDLSPAAPLLLRARLSRRLAWVAAGVTLLAAGVPLVMWLMSNGPPANGDPPLTFERVRLVTPEPGLETHPSLSPAGDWVAYAASGDIYLRHVGTEGDALSLTADMSLHAAEPTFSPDGRLIAFSARRDGTDVRGGIWLMEVMGAGKRQLTDAGFSPEWSPVGTEIAYATEAPSQVPPFDRPRFSRLWIADVTSGRTREVGTEDTMEPAWSPSGRRFAYWSLQGPSARRDIWTRPATGGEPTRVTDDLFVDWSPLWSRDGRYLFFCSNRGGSPNVWRVPIDEASGRVLGEAEPLTIPASVVMRLSFAANDESRFAYEVSDLEANVHRIAFDPVAETVRGEPVRMTSGARLWQDVDVSVDGRLVLRSSMRQEDIYVSDREGGNITPLAADDKNDRFPRWSPDGTRIAFTSTKGDEGYEIHTIRPDGRDLRRITYFEPASVHFPIWSPDGRRLAFTEYITVGGRTYAIDPDRQWSSEPLRPLLTPPGPLDLRYRPWSWSPDGRRIVAYSERGAGIIVYDVATGAHERITGVGAKPRWLSDSRRLLYVQGGALHLVDTQTKKSREIYRPSAGTLLDPAISHDDRWIYFIQRRDEGGIWVGSLKTREGDSLTGGS